MNLRRLFNDDDAVSPVIGVILMVAITVILAAVIASFVLGLGDQNNPGPTVEFEIDYDGSGGGPIDITHGEGDEIEESNLFIRGEELANTGNWQTQFSGEDDGGTVKAGHTATVSANNDQWVVNVAWDDPDSGTTKTLSKDRGPNA